MTGGCLPAKTWKSFMAPALKDVPVTEFNEPAPIKIITDKLSKAARTGIDPGEQRRPSGHRDRWPLHRRPRHPEGRDPAGADHDNHHGPRGSRRHHDHDETDNRPGSDHVDDGGQHPPPVMSAALCSRLERPTPLLPAEGSPPSGHFRTFSHEARMGTPKNTPSVVKPSGA